VQDYNVGQVRRAAEGNEYDKPTAGYLRDARPSWKIRMSSSFQVKKRRDD
jgi:hypothetical protein